MKAVGRVAMPHVCQPTDAWLLRGLLWCLACSRRMLAACLVDGGGRVYSCGPGCRQPDLPAAEIENHLALGAMIRAAVATVECTWVGPAVTAEEMRRWQQTDFGDRRAVLLAAYTRINVTAYGAIRPVWRHPATLRPAGTG